MCISAFPALRHWIALQLGNLEPMHWFGSLFVGFLLGAFACLIAWVLSFHRGDLDD